MPTTDAQRRASAKYRAKTYDEIKLLVPKGSREEISEELVDLVIGGLAKTDNKPRTKSKRKRKRDDILLPEI